MGWQLLAAGDQQLIVSVDWIGDLFASKDAHTHT